MNYGANWARVKSTRLSNKARGLRPNWNDGIFETFNYLKEDRKCLKKKEKSYNLTGA